MSAGAETVLVDEWIEDTLGSDVVMQGFIGDPARIFESVAPDGTKYPFVTYHVQTNQDTRGIGDRSARVMNRAQYVIKVVAEVDDYTTLKAVAKRLDDLIDGVGIGVSDGEVLAIARAEEYRQAEQEEGRQIRHLGGVYDIWATSNP